MPLRAHSDLPKERDEIQCFPTWFNRFLPSAQCHVSELPLPHSRNLVVFGSAEPCDTDVISGKSLVLSSLTAENGTYLTSDVLNNKAGKWDCRRNDGQKHEVNQKNRMRGLDLFSSSIRIRDYCMDNIRQRSQWIVYRRVISHPNQHCSLLKAIDRTNREESLAN